MQAVPGRPDSAGPARIAALSVLPIFLDLAGREAVVAGGSDAACWKAELLMAAGAAVRLVATREALGPETARLVAHATGDGALRYRDRRWADADLAGAAVAVLDAATEAEARAFAAAAARMGVPCNVIDRPALSGFQFGAIVNRSPVVVGISTSGAAPILGQAVRRRIEALLPPSLSAWAALAGRIRSAVIASTQPGARRRAFWEAFVDRAFGEPPPQDDAAVMAALASEANRSGPETGKVTFVQAHADPEHLTLKAVRALQAADVILFDDRVPAAALELARREARRVSVGSRAGGRRDIADLMIRLASPGRHVVRLASGDPTLPGRGREEIARLEAGGIGVTVVPGIPSEAAPDAATRRGFAAAVASD